MKKETLNEILEIFESAENYKQLVNKALDVIELYGPEFERLAGLLDKIRKQMVKQTIASYNQYKKAGFSHEEAMMLTLNTKLALEKAIEKINLTDKKK